MALVLTTPLPEAMNLRYYRTHAELVYGNIPLDAAWATQTQVWKEYIEKFLIENQLVNK